jgi:hypothetical protein
VIANARKRCSGCGADKPLTDFHRSSRYSDGRQIWCKACSRKATDRYQQRVGKSIIARSVKYGLTPDEVRAMMRIPVCQSCGAKFTDSYSRKFDHCHDRGHFRGVLCHACNMSCMGLAADAIPRLKCCIDYLQRDLERCSE